MGVTTGAAVAVLQGAGHTRVLVAGRTGPALPGPDRVAGRGHGGGRRGLGVGVFLPGAPRPDPHISQTPPRPGPTGHSAAIALTSCAQMSPRATSRASPASLTSAEFRRGGVRGRARRWVFPARAPGLVRPGSLHFCR